MKKYLTLIASAVIVIFLAFKLTGNLDEYFEDVRVGYADNTIINLDASTDEESFARLLLRYNYIDSLPEASFISRQITDRLKSGHRLENINDLKKRAWQTTKFDSLPNGAITVRLARLRDNLGQTSLSGRNLIPPRPCTGQNGKIVVNVTATDSSAMKLKQFLKLNKKAAPGVWVRLTHHYLDGFEYKDSILEWKQTDSNGRVVFDGLATDQFYSVLPVDSCHEYGAPRGTAYRSFDQLCGSDSTLNYGFHEQPFSVRLFGDQTLSVIRSDKFVTVRTPDEFLSSLRSRIFCIVGLFLVLAVVIRLKNRKAGFTLLSVLMLITGISVINMYSLANPLTDSLLGEHNSMAVIIGLLFMILLCFVDIVKFYEGRSCINLFGKKIYIPFDFFLTALVWFTIPLRPRLARMTKCFQPRGEKALDKIWSAIKGVLMIFVLPISLFFGWSNRILSRLPAGSGYLLAAIILTMLLFTPLGAKVGGMAVNLNLGIPVQPSEVAKYLLVIFMAAFFCRNARTIINYSKTTAASVKMFSGKLRMMLWVLVGIVFLMGLYLILGDMGPGMVILISFVLFYSMIKSAVEIKDRDDEKARLRKVLTCDICILVFGILTFLGFVWIGNRVGMKGLFVFLWFPAWLGGWYLFKRIQETAVMFNAILALFICGGSILNAIGLSSAGERFDDRMKMYENTWGVIDNNPDLQDPTSNTQVAQGMWALASGGLDGQGFGNGMSQVVPAFNTDMVVMSYGENTGFIGIIILLALYAILLWQTLKVGYRAKYKFALFLCIGIAIVTGVQLFVIIMGGLGMIPLTGVAVAFMSFGMSSIIMNFIAYGLVLSILVHTGKEKISKDAEERLDKSVSQYQSSMGVLSMVSFVLLVLIAASFFHNMVASRTDLLVRPVYAVSANGMPVIEYNPRIAMLTKRMNSGNIYDRKGHLLATSDRSLINETELYESLDIKVDTTRRQRRYYPFGNNTYFMVGDMNGKLFMSYSERFPSGYLAEDQHLSALRGFDNVYRDEEGNPRKVTVVSPKVRHNKFAPEMPDTFTYILRDYSALIPYLQAGVNSKRVERFNNREENELDIDKIVPADIQLTFDAELQTQIQNNIIKFLPEYNKERIRRGKGENHLMRISVVVLDAHNGDLLASANYPLPDYDLLQAELANRQQTGKFYYTDNYKDRTKWNAYTDRDLGLTYQSAPGSTAKVVSTMAALSTGDDQLINNMARGSYNVNLAEIIEGANGGFKEPTGNVNLRTALAISSNCYFINLVNDLELYDELGDLYRQFGMNITVKDEPRYPTYLLHYADYTPSELDRWNDLISSRADIGIKAYRKYMDERAHKKYKPMGGKKNPYYMWDWAWGQGGDMGNLVATPLNMARVISTAVNDGVMPHTQYVLNASMRTDSTSVLYDAKYTDILKSSMFAQADTFGRMVARKFTDTPHDKRFGGKTGTPERGRIDQKNKSDKTNDAWYIMYITDADVQTVDKIADPENIQPNEHHTALAIAIRVERSYNESSTFAMRVIGETVIPALQKTRYIDRDKK